MTTRRSEFERTVLPHLDDLYGLAMRLTRSARDAEDLVQETCLRAYSAWATFLPGSNARAWLGRILTNCFINGHRRARIADAIPDQALTDASWSPFAQKAAEDPESMVVDELLRDELDRALADLAPDARLVVLLCDVEGFQYREIADALGCPIGTVMSRLSRARRQLQVALADEASVRGIGGASEPLAA